MTQWDSDIGRGIPPVDRPPAKPSLADRFFEGEWMFPVVMFGLAIMAFFGAADAAGNNDYDNAIYDTLRGWFIVWLYFKIRERNDRRA